MFRRSTSKYASFLERRRSRQRGGDWARSYTLELAALHLELLVAMAAADDQVRSIEVEEVLAFVDRTSLPADGVAHLEQLARDSITSPPKLEVLSTQLEAFARRPAIARTLVDDLARVAAADSHADPREIEMLDFVCDALSLERISIDVPDPRQSSDAGTQHPRPPRGPRLVTQHRTRAAVRRALEASYKSRDF